MISLLIVLLGLHIALLALLIASSSPPHRLLIAQWSPLAEQRLARRPRLAACLDGTNATRAASE